VEKWRAQYLVKKALKKGTLNKSDSCEECGDRWCRIQAHHEDYDKPLEVIWLCPSCHVRKHPPNVKHDPGEIRRLYATGEWTTEELARKFSMHPGSISNVIHNHRHKLIVEGKKP
jgi:hypothetical protein